jgi:hypothetical protein
MKKLSIILLFLVSISINAKTYRVFYLGGQSNMDGYGYNKELTPELNKVFFKFIYFMLRHQRMETVLMEEVVG